MPITRIGVTTGAPASATTFTATLPTHQTGDRLTLVVTGKYAGITRPTINQGWVYVGPTNVATLGTGVAGNDTGTMFAYVYAKDATSSAEVAPTVTAGATVPNSWEWVCASHRSTAGKGWEDALAINMFGVGVNSDATVASPLSFGSVSSSGLSGGDAVFAVGGIPTDLGTALGTATITAVGITGGTVSAATTQYVENALGTDSAAVWAGWTGFTGVQTGFLGVSFTITGSANHAGALVTVVLREGKRPNPGEVKYFDGNDGWALTTGNTRAVTVSGSAGDKIAVVSASASDSFSFTSIGNNGAALTWTQDRVLDGSSGNQSALSLWTATLDTSRTVVISVTGNNAGSYAWGVGAWVAGAAVAVGATNIANNGTGSGAPSVSITTVLDGSQLACFVVDWNAVNTARTYLPIDGTAPVEDLYTFVNGQYTVFAFRDTYASPPGTKVMGVSSPSTMRYVAAVVEFTYNEDTGEPQVTVFTGWGPIPI